MINNILAHLYAVYVQDNTQHQLQEKNRCVCKIDNYKWTQLLDLFWLNQGIDILEHDYT